MSDTSRVQSITRDSHNAVNRDFFPAHGTAMPCTLGSVRPRSGQFDRMRRVFAGFPEDPEHYPATKKAAEGKRRGFFMCVALLVLREAQRALLASGLSRLPIVRYFAHRQLDAATVVEVQYHHVDFLAHLQHVFHALDALIGNL